MKFWPVCAVCVTLALSAGAQDATVPAVQPTGAAIVLTPASLEFDPLPQGTISQPKTATLTNPGTSEAAIQKIIASGIDFDQTNNCGSSLAAGGKCEIQVTFKPATIGSRVGNLTVVVSASAKPYMIALNGTGQ